jgi:thiol:disulfide interchange protein
MMMEHLRIRFAAAVLAAAVLLTAFSVRAQEEVLGGLPGEKAPAAGLFGKGEESEKSVVGVKSQFTAATADKPGRLFVTATIEPGYHVYSITQPTRESGNPTVTKIEVKPQDGVRLLGPFKASVAPVTDRESGYGDLPIEKHEGKVTWYAPLELAAGVDAATLKIAGTLSFGACDAKSCRMPESVAFTAVVGPGIDVPDEAADGECKDSDAPGWCHARIVLLQLALAFAGGFCLNFMPCVLPVLGLKVLAFVQQAGESHRRIFMLNVWYSIGMLSVFMVLAALASGVGMAAGARLGWGEQFTDNTFKIIMTALVFVMALSFLGVWEIPIPGFVGTKRANELQSKEGPIGAFCKGVFTTILATPCSGPFLGAVFGYVLKQPPYMAYCIFGAVGLGMASPYLLIGAYPPLMRFLPKPGQWMRTFEQTMGFLLMATVVYLFSLLPPFYVVPTLTTLLGLAFVCWWIGNTPATQPLHRMAAWFGGAVLATLIGVLAFTVWLQVPKIPWQPFSPAAVAKAQAKGKTVMVDFTADWCPNCKLNSKWAIETVAVRDLVHHNGVVPLLADFSNKSPAIKKALNDLGRNSIPLLVIWPGSGAKPIVLSDLLSEGEVLDALKQAGPSKKR